MTRVDKMIIGPTDIVYTIIAISVVIFKMKKDTTYSLLTSLEQKQFYSQ